MPTRIQIAKPDILALFDAAPGMIYKPSELAAILRRERDFWRLATSTSVAGFIEFLIASGNLRRVVFPFPKPYHAETRYTWGPVDLVRIALTLKPDCHLSHYSAVQVHGLTEQIPKTIHINFEQPLTSNSSGEMSQKSIDAAFKRKVRTTSFVAETDGFRVCVLNGKNTGYLGVVDDVIAPGTNARLRVTNLERTLIDIAVRPVYSGGVHEVAKAYELAKPSLSVNRLAAMLKRLAYIYPYHQAIGFYLERAGYRPAQLDLLRRFETRFDFYLEHQMKETRYVKEWRIHVPKGL